MKVRLGYVLFGLAIMVGVALGISSYTFQYANGLSYLSNDPKACVNCHIMQDQYNGWRKSSHHAVAVCNDCHVPHDFVGKYVAKGLNGYHHSRAFTLQDFHEPIMIGPRNAQILQDNCVRCHGDLVSSIAHNTNQAGSVAIKCTQCHREVGHGG